MISRGARHVILLSRSGAISTKVRTLIEESELFGAQVLVHACDVANRSQVHQLLHATLSTLPPIRGLIHEAMVLDDVLFESMTPTQWSTVISAKVQGAWNFHHELSSFTSVPLDFFSVLSSIAGTVGNRGQAAYAAANTFLNAFIQYRISLGLSGTSIDLTAVSDVGFLAENAEKQAQVAGNLGDEGIAECEVLALLEASIVGKMNVQGGENGGHCITGLGLSPNEDISNNFWIQDPRFAHLLTSYNTLSSLSSSSNIPSAQNIPLLTLIQTSSSFNAAHKILTEKLIDKTSAVLMIPREEMEEGKSVTSYGLDSLVGIEIRNWITRECGVALQVLELLTSGTVGGLGDLVLKRWEGDRGVWKGKEGDAK